MRQRIAPWSVNPQAQAKLDAARERRMPVNRTAGLTRRTRQGPTRRRRPGLAGISKLAAVRFTSSRKRLRRRDALAGAGPTPDIEGGPEPLMRRRGW